MRLVPTNPAPQLSEGRQGPEETRHSGQPDPTYNGLAGHLEKGKYQTVLGDHDGAGYMSTF